MKTKIALYACTALMAILLFDCDFANAQRPRQGGARRTLTRSKNPPISPNLDLLRGNNGGLGDFEFQYLRRLQPEREFRSAQQRLGQSVNTLQQDVTQNRNDIQSQLEARQAQQSVPNTLTPTGHSTAFKSYGGYYNFGQ